MILGQGGEPWCQQTWQLNVLTIDTVLAAGRAVTSAHTPVKRRSTTTVTARRDRPGEMVAQVNIFRAGGETANHADSNNRLRQLYLPAGVVLRVNPDFMNNRRNCQCVMAGTLA